VRTNKNNVILTILIFIVFLCSNVFAESQLLKDEVVLYGYNDEIYLTDGLGKTEKKLLNKLIIGRILMTEVIPYSFHHV